MIRGLLGDDFIRFLAGWPRLRRSWTGILIVLALQSAVVKFATTIRATAEKVLKLAVRRQDVNAPRVETFECFAHHAIDGFDFFVVAKSFAIRWIRNDASVVQRRRKIADFLAIEANAASDTGVCGSTS